MEESFINISMLNDFIFCPYSIYLHNVYENTDESLYHAVPQIRGRIVHETVDNKKASTHKDSIEAMTVYSEKYGIAGKIDVFKVKEHLLIERKYQLKRIFQGQLYQLWAQMLCLEEMGYCVEKLAFYETSTKKTIAVNKPTDEEMRSFEKFLVSFRSYDPLVPFYQNLNKCRHCIYCSLCDKTEEDNVYQ